MNASSAKRIMNPILSTTAGETEKAATNTNKFLLYHLLKEALHARNRELDKLHRIHDLTLQLPLLQSSEAPAWQNQNNGNELDVSETQPRHRHILHAINNNRYLPLVGSNSLASIELKTILDVLLERIHAFVPYRAALIRLGDGMQKRPLQTVAWRVCHDGTHDDRTAQSNERLAEAVLKCMSDSTIRNVRQNGYARGSTFPLNDSIHWRLGIPPHAGRRTLGVLSIFLQVNTSLESEKIKLLNILAAQTSRVIQSSLIYDQLKNHLANHGQGEYSTGLQKLLNHSGKIHSPFMRKKIRDYREKNIWHTHLAQVDS
jgi:transcriptional regulator with GAF, ATPase, and Fis domain